MNKPQIPVTLALIYNDAGELLIARRHQPEDDRLHDKWELVGGKVDFGESPEEAVVREVKEEAGLDVEVVQMVPKIFSKNWEPGQEKDYQVLLIVYICKVIGGELDSHVTDDEIAELKYIPPSDISKYETLPFVPEIVAMGTQLVTSN